MPHAPRDIISKASDDLNGLSEVNAMQDPAQKFFDQQEHFIKHAEAPSCTRSNRFDKTKGMLNGFTVESNVANWCEVGKL